jgi:hypothetical protein
LLSGNEPRTQRCKAIGIDKEEEEEEEEENRNKVFHVDSRPILSTVWSPQLSTSLIPAFCTIFPVLIFTGTFHGMSKEQ